jgi:hypothetical protein
MYRNSTVGSLPLGLSRRLLAQCCSLFACVLVFCGLVLFGSLTLEAQDTAGGGLQGTITDPNGAGVPKAEVTATNTDTGVQTSKLTSSTGTYQISPLQPGPYNVEVVAKGFKRYLQENVTIDANTLQGLSMKLSVGGEDTTVTVTDAPPFINTTESTLGGTIENELYSQLPLSMNGGPRDPTAFQYLMPGVQENPANDNGTGANNGNSGIYGGTGQTNLNENYIEGVPVSNINQQGSSNPVANAVSVDAVDQFSVQTSTASSSFGGAGSTNYTIKAGGNQFHGSVVDFIRNTDFDTWGYFAKVPASSGFAEKPGEHQNQYDISLGGPIFKDKLFFFGDYAGFHYTKISNTPQYITIPTVAERTGNFTDVLGTAVGYITDPTLGSYGSRPAFQGVVNGVPTFNVIPSSEISSISNYLQQALPAPTNLSTFNNYLASLPQANSDYSVDARLDYTLNSRNKFSLVAVGGNVGYGGEPFYSTQTQLPNPYAAGQYTNQKTASGIFSYVYIISQTLINTLKYGYSRNWGEGFSLTQGTKYNSTAAGINNLPPGNAANSMPAITFSQSNGPTPPTAEPNSNSPAWNSTASTGPVGTNSYVLQDALQWIKGRHNITFGIQVSWDETNGASFGGPSNTLALTYNANSTQYCVQSSTTTQATCPSNLDGDAYASFLVGAVYGYTIKTQSIQDVGARYRPIEPYVQDNWQVSPKLTLNLGLRYSYLQPYHEVHDRLAFLNVHITNPIVGIPGVLEYAGFPNSSTPAAYAPYLCHCTTPVKPYNDNFQPRLGFEYAYTPSTVFAGGFAINLTHAGGVGGNAGATQGTGNNGEFGATSSYSTTTTGDPAFYLNPGLQSPPNAVYKPPVQGTQPPAVNGQLGPAIPCVAANSCSALSAVPPWTVPGITVNPLQTTGDYNFTSYFPDHLNDYACNTADNISCQPGAVNFADPYYGGRGPQFISYNFSIQKMINKKAVLSVAYSGSQTHFLPGGAGRGPATNNPSPDIAQEYKGGLTGGCSTGCTVPYPLFAGSSATLLQALRPFPQFGTMTDLWGDTGNAAYNALQISVIQRPWHNLSGFVNYTRAKEVDDTGNHRTQYGVGPQDGNFTRNYSANEIDRGLGTANQTNAFNLTWVYSFPFGRGQAFFATNRIMGLIGGGWQLSGIYRYRDGYPLQVASGGGCTTNSDAGQGTCMPDYVPGFNKNQARINGRWGRGPGANAGNLNQISYLNSNGFECPDSSPQNITYSCGATTEPNTTFKLGNVARTAPYGLTGPGWWDIQLGLRRTFNVRETATLHLTFQVEADVDNATNSTFFNLSSSTWDTSAFGLIGGQNKSIQPRDWQFAGRFRF